MIFKGLRFRHSRLVVQLPVKAEDGSLMPYIEPEREQYVHFGRAVVGANEGTKGVVKTRYRWNDETPVYAKPIPLSGHSRTNMAYGKDRRVYLMHDGACFIGGSPASSASILRAMR